MNAGKKQDLLTAELIQKTVALRKKIRRYPKFLSTRKTYVRILSDIERFLLNNLMVLIGYANSKLVLAGL